MRRMPRLVRHLVRLVASGFVVDTSDLVSQFREAASIAFARQVAMYLAHTALGMTMLAVGRAFGRERQTVRHACHLVEDRRDDPNFDRRLAEIERALERLSPVERRAA